MSTEAMARKGTKEERKPMRTEEITALLSSVEPYVRLKVELGGMFTIYDGVLLKESSAISLQGGDEIRLIDGAWYCHDTRKRIFHVTRVEISCQRKSPKEEPLKASA